MALAFVEKPQIVFASPVGQEPCAPDDMRICRKCQEDRPPDLLCRSGVVNLGVGASLGAPGLAMEKGGVNPAPTLVGGQCNKSAITTFLKYGTVWEVGRRQFRQSSLTHKKYAQEDLNPQPSDP